VSAVDLAMYRKGGAKVFTAKKQQKKKNRKKT
jgi:hypothetical protein